jgi:hypothetical protein
MKPIIIVTTARDILAAAKATDLYWKIVDPHGKLPGNPSTATTDVSGPQKVLQAIPGTLASNQ